MLEFDIYTYLHLFKVMRMNLFYCAADVELDAIFSENKGLYIKWLPIVIISSYIKYSYTVLQIILNSI